MSVKQDLAAHTVFMPHVSAVPTACALLKSDNQHFIVDEDLGFVPSGEGEHLYLQIQNDGDNTQWVAENLAKKLGVAIIDVGYCGLKDRNAITSQWFSVYDPKKDVQSAISTQQISLDHCRVLTVSRGQSKLRRGMHKCNIFTITLVLENFDIAELSSRLEKVKVQGVPNYFGLQRFGREGNNLHQFDDWLSKQATEATADKRNRKPRKPKGIILSAARSQLFNRVLAQRVIAGTWAQIIAGDVLLNDFPTGPLWGRGRSASKELAAQVECHALMPLSNWAQALEHLGLNQERRSFVSMPQDFNWNINGNYLTVQFSLPPGEYATSVLRELSVCVEPDRHIGVRDT